MHHEARIAPWLRRVHACAAINGALPLCCAPLLPQGGRPTWSWACVHVHPCACVNVSASVQVLAGSHQTNGGYSLRSACPQLHLRVCAPQGFDLLPDFFPPSALPGAGQPPDADPVIDMGIPGAAPAAATGPLPNPLPPAGTQGAPQGSVSTPTPPPVGLLRDFPVIGHVFKGLAPLPMSEATAADPEMRMDPEFVALLASVSGRAGVADPGPAMCSAARRRGSAC